MPGAGEGAHARSDGAAGVSEGRRDDGAGGRARLAGSGSVSSSRRAGAAPPEPSDFSVASSDGAPSPRVRRTRSA